jgi:hypothetical protein
MRIQWCITSIFAASLVLLVAGSATAQFDRGNSNSLLQGTYRYTMVVTCSSSSEFTALPDLRPIGGGNAATSHATGLITYDGRGHATVDERGILISPGPYPNDSAPEHTTIGPIVYDTKHCDWTYKVHGNRTFTQGGDCRGFDRTGPELFGIPGEQVDITNTRLEGQIGAGGLILIWNGVAPTIETLSTDRGFTTKRVCGYSGTAVRVGRDD